MHPGIFTKNFTKKGQF